MKIIERGGMETSYSFSVTFKRLSCPDSGYEFDCDEAGNLLDPSKAGRIKELQKDPDIKYTGITRYVHRWKRPSVGLCDCGRKVSLPNFTNTCRCGRSYNWAGQRLSARSCWGEETGEHPADISRI